MPHDIPRSGPGGKRPPFEGSGVAMLQDLPWVAQGTIGILATTQRQWIVNGDS
jgi:hypothetical protein